DGFAVLVDVDKHGLGGGVVIPEIVVHDLEVPDDLAGFGAQRDDAVRIQVAAGAFAAVVVGRCAAGGDEDEAAFGVDGHDGPGVGRAGLGGGFGGPLLVAGVVRGARDRIPQPAQFAGAGVVGADRTALEVDRAVVANGGADDHGIAEDGGRR